MKKVAIKWRVVHKTDTTPPDVITNLRLNKAEPNSIELVWDPSPATDLKEYLVERDGKRIATTPVPSYSDTGLKPGSQYSYSISGVDTSCNIGTSADILTATKTGGTSITPAATPEINLSCETPYQTTTAENTFSINVPLTEGINDLEIILEDSAGNKEVIEHRVRMDNTAPKLVETNLDKISPSYVPDITIKGKLDEQATVLVYINDEQKPSEYKVTDPDGTFSIKTRLRTDVRIKKGATKTTVEVGEGWANRIRLEAVDIAGNKATFGPYDVDFLLCGLGTWWSANIGEALPNILLPRLMVQGIQQIGIPFNITYIGTHDVKLGRIDVRPIMLSKGAEKDYDHDWVQVNAYTRAKGKKNAVGYIQIQFENVNPLPEKPEAGPNEKERALSGHRRGECLVPGTGCVKLFLQMEIQFQEIVAYKPAEPGMPIVTPKIEPRMQKVCIPIEVAIDQTIPSDIIPKGLLKTTISAIDKAISLIDKVLKPITTIGEYVLYGCLASNVWLVLNWFTEKMACEGSALIDAFAGAGGGWNKAVAEAGLCEPAYKDNPAKMQKCMTCQNKIESRKKFEMNVMHGLCDRVGCPSAPTLSYYIKSNVGNAEPLEEISASVQKNDANYFQKWAVGGPQKALLYAGNDCAFSYGEMNYITQTYKETAGKLGINEIYNIATGKEQPRTFPQGPTKDDCKKILHPAHPNCCGVQYQKDWSSACGIGTTLGESLDLFDELKQSTCLSAQQANDPDQQKLGCNQLWNAVAGFCESKTGEPTAQVVSLEAEWVGPKPARPGADANTAYLFVVPRGFEAGRQLLSAPAIPFFGGGGTATGYSVHLGYAVKTPRFEKMTEQEAGINKANQLRLSAGLTAALDTDVSKCFGQAPQVRAEKGKTPEKMTEEQQIACLEKELCKPTASGYRIEPCERGNLKRAYDKVNDIVGVPDQQYIVRPYSGLLRSIQCICLPAVTSYLQMWRTVLGALHGCFSKILLTGEGSAGFCAAKLSSTICDLLFEFITCITQKFNAPGVGARPAVGGFGNVLGALTGAGTEVSRSINQRYGETSLYKSLFSERKLVHAICIWAFTGTWDLNIQGLFQQQVEEIPVDTEGALTTCERTFISYDPTSTPSGMTTWAYRIAGGLIAGADVRYRLKLKCSSGFNCDPRQYPDGKCDCTTREEILPVSAPELGNGLARKFDLVNFDAPFVVSPQNSFDLAGYRYDTAILEWEWTDPQTKQVRTDKAECSVREVGGAAPAFCALDAFSGKFRCLFGEQESGIRIISAKEAYPEKQKVFALGDKLNFSLEIKQVFPEERKFQNQARKFLTYEIRDAAGNIVDAQMPDRTTKLLQITNDATSLNYVLTTNGNYRLMVPMAVDDTPIGTFVVNEDTINRHSAMGPIAAGVQQDIWPVSSLKKFVTTLNVKEGNTPATTKYGFLINFIDYGKGPSEAKYEVRMINPAALDKLQRNERTGWLDSAQKEVLATGQQSPDNPKNRITFTIPGTAAKPETSVVLDFDRVVFSVDKMQILAIYTPTGKEAERKGCDRNTPIPWKAYFTIYDADRQGNPSEQISTDPETGEQQQKQVQFFVQCAPKSAVQEAEAAPKEFEAAAKILIAMLNNLKKEESKAIEKARNITNEKKDAIIAFLKQLASNERNAQIAISNVAANIKEEALRKSVQALTIMNALTTAADNFEAQAKMLEGTLPGEEKRAIETALNNTIKTLTDLQKKKDEALQKLGAPTAECAEVNGICQAICPDEDYGPLDCPEGTRCCEKEK